MPEIRKIFNFEVVMIIFWKDLEKFRIIHKFWTLESRFFDEVSVSKFRSRLHLWDVQWGFIVVWETVSIPQNTLKLTLHMLPSKRIFVTVAATWAIFFVVQKM